MKLISSVDKHIENLNEDENCDGTVAELNPHHESDDDESENKDVRHNTGLINLKDALPSIARHRVLASELGTTLLNLLANVEKK